MAFVEFAWTSAAHIQGEDRVFARLNDLHGATIYYLVAKDSIEEKIVRILQAKQGVLDSILDGGEDTNEFNLFDQLKTELLQETKHGRKNKRLRGSV